MGEIAGDVSQIIESSFEWKIPEWQSLFDEYDAVRSPSFQFWEATWEIGIARDEDEDSFYIYVKSDFQTQDVVEVRIRLKEGDETEYQIFSEGRLPNDCDEYRSSFGDLNLLIDNTASCGRLTTRWEFFKKCRIAKAAAETPSLSGGFLFGSATNSVQPTINQITTTAGSFYFGSATNYLQPTINQITTTAGGFYSGSSTNSVKRKESEIRTTAEGFSFGSTTNFVQPTVNQITTTAGGFSFGSATNSVQPTINQITTTATYPSAFSNSYGSCRTSIAPMINEITRGNSKLVKDLNSMFLNGEESDVIIKVKDSEFKAHKCILRARSPVFYSMFNHDMAEKKNNSIEITDCDPEAVKIFLLYLYNGRVQDSSPTTTFHLYKLADKYDVEELKLICTQFIQRNLSIDTICDAVEHALLYSEANLLKSAIKFFTKNFKKIILTVKWQSFLGRNPVAANELLIKAFHE